jgi:hypothetical protein
VAIVRSELPRLADVGLCRPGEGDMATHGHPGKLSWLVAENLPASPWPPFSTERGGPADASGVTVFPGVGNLEIVLPTTGPVELVEVVARVLRGVAAAGALLLVPPESAHFLSRHGWDAARLADELGSRGVTPPLLLVTGGTGIKATLVPAWGGPCEPVTRWLDEPGAP